MFKYAKSKRYIDRDIAKYVSDALFIKHEAKHYKYVATEAELSVLLKKIKDLKASFEVKACIQLAILTFARPSEVAGMKRNIPIIDRLPKTLPSGFTTKL